MAFSVDIYLDLRKGRGITVGFNKGIIIFTLGGSFKCYLIYIKYFLNEQIFFLTILWY